LDSEADGLPDGWEWSNFATLTNTPEGDYDGDGADNFSEYIAGTQPTNMLSFFHVIVASNVTGGERFQFTIPTEPDRHYTVEYTDALSSNTSWSGFANTNLGVGTWLETGLVSGTHTFTDDFTTNTSGSVPASGRRFYRVRVRKEN